jgi:excisionase family DNA binding protein
VEQQLEVIGCQRQKNVTKLPIARKITMRYDGLVKITNVANSPVLTAKWHQRRMAQMPIMRATMEQEKGLISPRQAASLLGVTRAFVRELVKRGELKSFRFLGHHFLSFDEVVLRRTKDLGKTK